MCGRFSNIKKVEELAKIYNALPTMGDKFRGNFNIAPTEIVPIILDKTEQDSRSIEMAAFGMKRTVQGKTFPLLNFRSETSTNREEFKKRRCVVPATGFYEWLAHTPKEKQPYLFSPKDNGLLSFAGVWQKDGNQLSFTILTTSANDLVGEVHDRMPVILSHNAVGQWLAADSDTNTLTQFLTPYPSELMQAWRVGKEVNNPRYKEASCINSL